MRITITDFLDDREAVRELAFSERFEPPTDDVRLPHPVEGTFVLRGAGGTVRLTGRARTVADVVCGACLTHFALPLEIAVDEELYRPGPTGETSREELGPEDFLTSLEPGDVLNVSEIVRQHLALAVPIAPRCRENCRGLCPHCGADLNAGPCGCDARTVDPRLEPLKKWSAASSEPADVRQKAPARKPRRAPEAPLSRKRKRASGE